MEALESFHSELKQIVTARAAAEHLVDTLAFISELAERLSDDPVFGEYRQAEHQGRLGSSNFKIHGYTEFDESDGTLGLVVGLWSDAPQIQTLTTSEVNGVFSNLVTFVEGSVQKSLNERIIESSSAYELSTFLKNSFHNITRLRLHLFSNSSLSQRFKESVEGQILGVPIERHVWDLIRIKSLYESSREREAVELKLADFQSQGIDCLFASQNDELTSYLCVIEGNLLADLFERYGSRLLEGNVRSFLGMKGGVNKGIRSTIQDNPALFFAYNNGIAATATRVVTKEINGKTRVVELTDLQIVNGGQTTASVLSARKKDGLSLNNVAVPMKLTEVNIVNSNSLIPRIAQYANTQNKIAIADFFANHPVHRKLEEISRRLRTPARAGQRLESKWFYERSRGQYQNERLYLSKAKRDMFDLEYPASQVINKTDLAKFDSAWRGKPFWIAQGAQKNFTRFAQQFASTNDQSENDYWDSISPKYGDGYYQDMVSIAIIWKHSESMVSAARDSWYEGDYRAQIVAYTTAYLFEFFRINAGAFNLNKIWTLQSIPSELSRALEGIAKNIQKEILNPPPGTTNVGEWTKKEDCWSRIQKLRIPWETSLDIWAIANDDLRQRKKDDRKIGEIDDAFVIQKIIIELSSQGYWDALNSWDDKKLLFTPSEKTLLSKAKSLTSVMKISLERDWRKLIEIKTKAEDDGFRHNAK
jgi:hypothetical protein